MSEAFIVFWDVQHGHATYVKTPNGRHVVIDLGTGSYGSGEAFSPLEHLRSRYKITQLDYVVITHPHVDHIDDVFCFDDLNPKVLLRPKHLAKGPILEKASDNDRPKLDKYFEISERYNSPIAHTSPNSPANPANWGGLHITSYIPSQCAQSNVNNHSIVTVFEFGGIRVLVPGDNEPPSWNELMGVDGFASRTKDVDLMLAPHHGRNSGFDADTMNHLNPRITVISDGAYCDTSATTRYTAISRGWNVYKPNGQGETRYCLTTRKDGVVTASFGKNPDGKPFLHVEIG
ncbi:MAG: ComEC/Rec2 family competence protein [Desulfomonilaceae bacterium]